MVYLPGEIRQRRSANAASLYDDQAQMGVVSPPLPRQPVATPQPSSGVPTPPGGVASPVTAPSGQQPSRLSEYIQGQQQQRQMLAARGQDLQLANNLVRSLDPSMPKGFRQLGLRQVSQMLGIDPKGDRSKELINTLSSLDPQSLEGMRRGIVSATDEMQPGQLTEITRGILTGQVPPDQLLQLASAATGPPAPTGTVSPGTASPNEEPMMRLGGPGLGRPEVPEDASPLALAQAPGLPGSGPSEPPGPGPETPGGTYPPMRRLFDPVAPAAEPTVPREAQMAPGNREVIPELTSVLGLDPGQRYRVRDLYDAGFTIPSSETHMRTVAADTRTAQTALVQSFTMMSQLAGLVRGRPEALGYPTPSIHLPTHITQFGEYVRGIGQVLGVTVEPGTARRVLDDKVEGAEGAIDGITSNVARWYGDTYGRVRDASELNARIRAIVVPLAFAMAAAEGQTGRHLSDRDVQLQLQRLGESNDPARFIAALSQTANLLHNQHNTRMRAQFGQEVPLARVVSPEIADVWRAGGIIEPPTGAGGNPATPLAGGPTPTRAGDRRPAPTTPPPAGSGWSLDMGGERTEFPPGPLPTSPTPPVPPAATTAPETTPVRPAAPIRIPRSSPTLNETEAGDRARVAEEREYLHETRGQQRRRLELAESQEARAQRAEVEARRARIQQTFAQIGAMLRGATSGGGGGVISSPGGDQDAAAFRLSPGPQRRAPTPVPAAPFQPQPPTPRRRPR